MKKSLTYDQVFILARLEDEVKNHIEFHYPKLSYGQQGCILGRFGRELSKTSWKKIEKLAKKDQSLLQLVFNYKVKEIELWNS